MRRHKRGIRVDEIAAALSMGHVTLRVAIKAADQGGVKARAYPAMADRARAEDAEIHWGDETAVININVRGRSHQPKGQTPVAYAVGGTRHKLLMISTVTR